MPKIKKDKILGYEADSDYYCADCAESKGNEDEAKYDKLLTTDTMEKDEFYFCKNCGKKIGSGSSGGGGGFL